MNVKKTTRQTPQLSVRIPEPLKKKLKKIAERERRTLNAQINIYIEEGLERSAA